MSFLLMLEASVGLLFTLIAIGVNLFFSENFSDFYFVLFAFGFGLICHAFGSAARITTQLYTVTGSAALALILLGTFHALEMIGSPSVVKLKIDDVPIGHTVSVRASDQLFGRKRLTSSEGAVRKEASHEFILDPQLVLDENIRINICCDINANGEQMEEEVYHLSNDSVRKLINLGQTRGMRRQTRGENKYLVDISNNSIIEERSNDSLPVFSAVDSFLFERSSALGRKNGVDRWYFLSSPAQANQSGTTLNGLITDLNDSVSDVRRQARTRIAGLGPSVVTELMAVFRSDERYRVRLGIIVALEEMVGRHSNQRSVIASRISDANLKTLFDLIGNKDKTMRVRAVQLVSVLGDRRNTPFALSGFGQAGEAGKGNRLIIIEQSIKSLSSDQRHRYAHQLKAYVPRLSGNLKAFASNIVRINLSGGSDDYAIVFGKFLDEKSAESAAMEIQKSNNDLNISIGKLVNSRDGLPVVIGELPANANAGAVKSRASSVKGGFDTYVIGKDFIGTQKAL